MSLPSRRADDDAGRKRAPALRLKFRRSWRAALGVVHASADHRTSDQSTWSGYTSFGPQAVCM
jgi:hypothetical protein